MRFNRGEKILCINDLGERTYGLRRGDAYTVREFIVFSEGMIRVLELTSIFPGRLFVRYSKLAKEIYNHGQKK